MADDLHERLTDYLTNLEVTVRPVDGHAHIVAESMADALLPFICREITAELQWLLAPTSPPDRYPTAVLGRIHIRLNQHSPQST